jgi:hypothetical protein
MLCVSILLSASPTIKRLPVCFVTSKTFLPRIAQVSLKELPVPLASPPGQQQLFVLSQHGTT